MKAGFHTADITPALGMEAPGGYGKVYIQRIHDPLKVRAAVFESGETTVAFVGIEWAMDHQIFHLPIIDHGVLALAVSSPDKWPGLFPFFLAGAIFVVAVIRRAKIKRAIRLVGGAIIF